MRRAPCPFAIASIASCGVIHPGLRLQSEAHLSHEHGSAWFKPGTSCVSVDGRDASSEGDVWWVVIWFKFAAYLLPEPLHTGQLVYEVAVPMLPEPLQR